VGSGDNDAKQTNAKQTNATQPNAKQTNANQTNASGCCHHTRAKDTPVHLVLTGGERVQLLQHVGDALDDALAHLLHADVPDGTRGVTHLKKVEGLGFRV